MFSSFILQTTSSIKSLHNSSTVVVVVVVTVVVKAAVVVGLGVVVQGVPKKTGISGF